MIKLIDPKSRNLKKKKNDIFAKKKLLEMNIRIIAKDLVTQQIILDIFKQNMQNSNIYHILPDIKEDIFSLIKLETLIEIVLSGRRACDSMCNGI